MLISPHVGFEYFSGVGMNALPFSGLFQQVPFANLSLDLIAHFEAIGFPSLATVSTLSDLVCNSYISLSRTFPLAIVQALLLVTGDFNVCVFLSPSNGCTL